jgi:hypothetical protein
MTMKLTRDQIEAMGTAEVAAARDGLRQAVIDVLCEIGLARDINPIEAARHLATRITDYSRTRGWTDQQVEYAVSYLAEVGATLQDRFDVVLGRLVDQGVDVWCHVTGAPARYSAETGCSACRCDGVHTILAEAARTCTHGADCRSHPGVTGPHNYDRPQL